MTQPATTELWCTDVTDPEENVLKVSPPPSVKDTGLLRGTPFARVWHNFYFNYITQGLAWLFDDVHAVGAVVSYTAGNNPDFDRWRGTWTVIGQQTIGTETVNYFERTA